MKYAFNISDLYGIVFITITTFIIAHIEQKQNGLFSTNILEFSAPLFYN